MEELKHNILSISQLCDNDYEVSFKQNLYIVKKPFSNEIIIFGPRQKNLYTLYLDDLTYEFFFISIDNDKWIWHKRVDHISMKTISNLSKLDLVRDLPKINFDKDAICEACIKVKQVKIASTRKILYQLTNHLSFFT